MSDAEVNALLDKARSEFDLYFSVQQSTALLREQLESQLVPTYTNAAPAGFVIHKAADGVLG